MTRPRARARHAFPLAAAIAIVVACLPWAAAPASAASDDSGPGDSGEVRWTATPADESGADGRRFVEHELDPGESVVDHLAVRNVGEHEVTFRLAAADGFYTRSGRFDMLPADQESVASGTWIDLPDSVTVPGGETVVVPFTIAVPDRAEPGDHAAGITASVLSVQQADDGTSVGVESRVGFRVITRVTGEIAPAAAIGDVEARYETSWNPLQPGRLVLEFDVENDGNTRLFAAGTVEAGGRQVVFPAEGEAPQELLPGDVRTLTVAIDDVWPLLLVPATASFAPTAVTMDGAETVLDPVTSEVLAWAVPWPQLVGVGGVALLAGALLWGRIRSRKRIDALLEQAREEGRRAAMTAEAS